MISRPFTFIMLFVSIIFLPFWIYLPLIFVAIILKEFYWESVVLGFVIDVLYGSGALGMSEFISPIALSYFIIVICVFWIKSGLRFKF